MSHEDDVIDLMTDSDDEEQAIEMTSSLSCPASQLKRSSSSDNIAPNTLEPCRSPPTDTVAMVCRLCSPPTRQSSKSALRQHIQFFHFPVVCSCGKNYSASTHESKLTGCCDKFDRVRIMKGLNMMQSVTAMIMSHCDPNLVDQVNDHLDRVISTFGGSALFNDSIADDADSIEDMWEEEQASLANGIEEIIVVAPSASPSTVAVETAAADSALVKRKFKCPVANCGIAAEVFSADQMELVQHVASKHMDFDLMKCFICELSKSKFHFRLHSLFSAHHSESHGDKPKRIKPLPLTAEQENTLQTFVTGLYHCGIDRPTVEDIAWKNIAAIGPPI